MKKIALLFCILLLLNLSACNVTEQPGPTYEPVCGDGPAEEVTTPTEVEQNAIVSKEDSPKPLIGTPYYTLSLPQDWEGKCVWEMSNQEDGTYTLTLYEVTSHDLMEAGMLCSIILLPTNEDWADFPDYTIHGILHTSDGDYQIIALYPTDVQFDENTAETYNVLSEQISDVLCTLSPAPGIEMVAPAPVL